MNDKNKIDIICYYDNHHKNLYDMFFYPTYETQLSNNFNLITHTINSPYKNTGFQSKNWSEILINRFDILKDYIKNNINKWAIFSDVDIIFLNNFYDDIVSILNQNETQIYYMSETIKNPQKYHINGGFILFKCCDYIYDFFTNIQDNTKLMKIPNDQTYTTQYLKNNPNFQSNLLDNNIFVTNNHTVNISINLIRKKMIKVFHATSTTSTMEKVQVLSTVLCLNNLLHNNKSTFRPRLWTQ